MKLTPMPVCDDCGYVCDTNPAFHEMWTTKPSGAWQCIPCWNKEHHSPDEDLKVNRNRGYVGHIGYPDEPEKKISPAILDWFLEKYNIA
jgi:hypothetical protein